MREREEDAPTISMTFVREERDGDIVKAWPLRAIDAVSRTEKVMVC